MGVILRNSAPPSTLDAWFAGVLDTQSDGIIVVDEQARILVFNKACERLFGYAADQILGRNVSLLIVDGQDIRIFKTQLVETTPGGDRPLMVAGQELAMQHRDGTIVPVELAMGVALTPDGRQHVCVMRDLRPRKAIEQKLSKLQAELVRLGRNSARDEMESAVAHEINQPLTALTLYLQAMQHNDGQPAGTDLALHAIIDKAVAEAERACAIVRRMRRFAENRTPECKLVDVRLLIDDAIDLTLAGHRHAAHMIREDDPDLPRVWVDPVQFQQIVVNLIRNALEAVAGREYREIRVTTRLGDAAVELWVEDNGPGIPLEAVDDLFHVFSTMKGKGLGLGLAISRTIAVSHGGNLRFDPGRRGAKFVLSLPLTKLPMADITVGS